jgi:hypothetical protein
MRRRRVRSRSTIVDHQAAVLEDEAAAVVDQPVLSADRVRVEQQRLVVGGAGREHLAPRRVDAHAIRRGRDVDDDLGARVAAAPHRPVGRPRVLADFDGDVTEIEMESIVAEGNAVPVERQPGAAARERAPFVEHVVGRQLFLGHDARDDAAMHDRGGVEDLAAGRHGEADDVDRRRAARFFREALELLALPDQKARPLHEIFRRVAADGLFGKRADRDVRVGHFPGDRDQAGDV